MRRLSHPIRWISQRTTNRGRRELTVKCLKKSTWPPEGAKLGLQGPGLLRVGERDASHPMCETCGEGPWAEAQCITSHINIASAIKMHQCLQRSLQTPLLLSLPICRLSINNCVYRLRISSVALVSINHALQLLIALIGHQQLLVQHRFSKLILNCRQANILVRIRCCRLKV